MLPRRTGEWGFTLTKRKVGGGVVGANEAHEGGAVGHYEGTQGGGGGWRKGVWRQRGSHLQID